MRKVFGFSLIELMIVMSIISILTVMALPTYRRYVERARFTEVMTTANIYKLAVALALQQGAPSNEIENGRHGIPESPKPTPNLASIIVKNGVITATATLLALSATYILKPNQDGNLWSVSGSCLKYGFCHD